MVDVGLGGVVVAVVVDVGPGSIVVGRDRAARSVAARVGIGDGVGIGDDVGA
jgi:hypothetical protein